MFPHPGSIGLGRGQISFDFVIFLEFTGFDVDQNHFSGGQAFLAQDLLRRNVQHSCF